MAVTTRRARSRNTGTHTRTFGRGEDFKTLFPTLPPKRKSGLPATFLKTELAGATLELGGAAGVAVDAFPRVVEQRELVAALTIFRLAGGVVEARGGGGIGLHAEARGVDAAGGEAAECVLS